MAHFILHRTHTHSSRMGHIISFVRGEPTYVPPECRREVMQIGAIPVDSESRIDLLDPVKMEPLPLSGEERREQRRSHFFQIFVCNILHSIRRNDNRYTDGPWRHLHRLWS